MTKLLWWHLHCPETLLDENTLSHAIIGAAIEVHRHLGAGLLESIYEEALVVELAERGMKPSRQVLVPISYKGRLLNPGLKLDLIIDERVIVEVKAVERILNVHQAQLLSYLRLTGKRLGLLINFNSVTLKHAIRRVVNGLPQ